MKKIDRSATKAGLFIIASVVLLLAIIVSIKGVSTIFTPVVERHVRFSLTDDIGGLRLGDDVRLGGFKIGAIRAIEVNGTEDGQQPIILITFTSPEKYPLRKNAHIAVQGTVTGSSWLNIDDLGSGPLLGEADELQGNPSATAQLLASLSKTTPELEALVHDVHTVTVPSVNQAIEKSHRMIDSISGFADHGSEVAVQFRDILGDKTTDIRGTLANLNSITGTAKTKLPKVIDDADAALVKVTDTIDNSRGTLADLKVAMANTKELTGSARSILIDNRGKIDSLIASLKTTSDNLKGASVEIRRSPWRLLYKPAPGEMENLNLFDAARQFAEGANSVDDAATSLRDASRDPNADPQHLQKLLDQLNQSFTNFHEVEQKLWQAVKE
jgi:ABC-type transporter Mla subunit MlaD